MPEEAPDVQGGALAAYFAVLDGEEGEDVYDPAFEAYIAELDEVARARREDA
jgi:hypothetical protein